MYWKKILFKVIFISVQSLNLLSTAFLRLNQLFLWMVCGTCTQSQGKILKIYVKKYTPYNCTAPRQFRKKYLPTSPISTLLKFPSSYTTFFVVIAKFWGLSLLFSSGSLLWRICTIAKDPSIQQTQTFSGGTIHFFSVSTHRFYDETKTSKHQKY